MTKHTPAPWHINPKMKTSINAGRKHIAMVNWYNPAEEELRVIGEEHEANAHLIAAAPDLLATLETTFEALKNGTYDENHAAMIEAVINKARGAE